MPRKRGVQTACCVCGYHKAVGKLLVCERGPKNPVGTYCGSKDDDLSDTGQKVVVMSNLQVLKKRPSRAN